MTNWDAISVMQGTIILMMAVGRMEVFANVLLKGYRTQRTPMLVIQEGSVKSQLIFHTTLGEVSKCISLVDIKPPAIIIIGCVTKLN